jgi:hypothetical protein
MSLDRIHDKWKNHKTQSPTNQTSKDKSVEKSITQKIVIKRIRLRIKKTKKKLEGIKKTNIKVLNWK